jgi:hypothetical protein
MSELQPPASLNAVFLGFFNYSLGNEWVTRDATRLLCDPSRLPVINIPPAASNLFITARTALTTTVANTISNLSCYIVWDNMPLVGSLAPGNFWQSNGINVNSGDLLVGPGSANTPFMFMTVGESADTIAPKMVSDPTAGIPHAAVNGGNFNGQTFSTLRAPVYTGQNAVTLNSILPERVRIYLQFDTTADVQLDAGAVVNTELSVYAITESN